MQSTIDDQPSSSDNAEGWTFVGKKKKSGAKRINRCTKSMKSQIAIQKALQGNDIKEDRSTQDILTEIENCLNAFKLEKDGIYLNLRSALLEALVERSERQNNIDDQHLVFCDIVCYGIGNFSKRYSPPMLQLTCALLLRDILQQFILDFSYSGNDRGCNVYYYEPCMTSTEQSVLKNYSFHVIDQNERGKRIVDRPTIFYMPHCPMRLYSNVVWANWDSILSGKILIFGNSFHAYDERSIQSTFSSDPTNAISRVLPFCVEKTIKHCCKKKGKKIEHNDTISNVSVAFNDCSIMSFCYNRVLKSKQQPIDDDNKNDDSDNGCDDNLIVSQIDEVRCSSNRPQEYFGSCEDTHPSMREEEII